MANTTWYGDGTATVAVGSRTVTGTDTGWLTEVAGLTPIKVGDKFGIHVGRPIVIEQIISDTELLLADDWPGPAQTDAPYKVELTSPTIAAVEAMRRLLASLSNGNLDSLSEITVGTDDIPIGIGPGVFGTINKFTLKDGVQFDVAVPNMAGRAAYNGAAAGFRVLVADIGDGRSALYIKNSATSGDWSVPYYITGPVGPAGVNQRGNYSAGTAYAIRDIVQYGGSTWIAKVATTGNAPPTLPTTENTQWLLFARSGTPGVVDRGTYSAGAAYEANDIVLDNGSTWIALQSTTGNAPPALPTESNAYWRLLARKGTDGTGTGDFVGPNGGVAAGDVVAFADTTGKTGRKATSDELRASTMLSTGNLFGFRNVVINGGFTEWQRALSQTISGYGSDDRWDNSHVGTTKTHSLQNFPLGQTAVPGEPAYFSRTVVSSVAGATNYCQKLQRIEGVRTLAGRKATFTFYARSDAPRNMFVEIMQDFGTGGSPSPTIQVKGQIVALTTAMTRYDVVFDVPSLGTKTIGTNGNDNLRVGWWFDAGSSFSDRTMGLGQQSGTFDIARVSLVDGDARNDPDPFTPRHPVIERTLCERYYQTVSVVSMTGVTYTSNGDTRAPMVFFKTRMRASPTVSVSPANLVVIACGALNNTVNVDIGNMSLLSTADGIRITNVSNGGAMSPSGEVASWGDPNGRTFFANAEI